VSPAARGKKPTSPPVLAAFNAVVGSLPRVRHQCRRQSRIRVGRRVGFARVHFDECRVGTCLDVVKKGGDALPVFIVDLGAARRQLPRLRLDFSLQTFNSDRKYNARAA
jgi:hypothetical protein